MKSSGSNQELKKLVGNAAAQLVDDGMICGIGTGSTVAFFITGLGRRIKEENIKITGVPTSFQARILCRENGIPILEAQDCTSLDLAVDGADEVDPELNLIKGGGAAHTVEKIVAAMAKKFIVIVDESKLVPQLNQAFPVPVEIIPAARNFVGAKIKQLGGEPNLRLGVKKDGPVVTDNGQFILDINFKPGTDLRQVDRELHQIPGVIETGFFFDLAKSVLVGKAEGMTVHTMAKP